MTLTSITPDTPRNLFFRTGQLTANGISLGALTGNIVFRVAKEDFIPDLAGAAGEVKGTRYRISETATLQGTLTEWQMQLLAYAIAGIAVSSDASSEVLGSSDDSADTVGCISDSEYLTIVFTGAQCDGLQSTIHLWNAIADGDFEGTFDDKGMFTYNVTFKATYDPADPDMRPWAIVHHTA